MSDNHAWRHILGVGSDIVPNDDIPTISTAVADRPSAASVTPGTTWINSTYNPGDLTLAVVQVSDGSTWRTVMPSSGSFQNQAAAITLEPYDHYLINSTLTMVAGTLYLARVIIDDLYACSRLRCRTASGVAAGVTNFYHCAYDSTGALIYQSADNSSVINGANGSIIDSPAANPVFMLGPPRIGPVWNYDVAYFGVYAGGFTTAPVLRARDYTPWLLQTWESTPGIGGSKAIGTGLTTMPSVTLSTITTSGSVLPWIAVGT